MSGGEPDARRLLELARRELLDQILPELSGGQRYRLRLIANAMKIARREMSADPPRAQGEGAAEGAVLAGFAAGAGLPAEPDPHAAIRAALRGGKLDGNADLYGLLVKITGRRLDGLG